MREIYYYLVLFILVILSFFSCGKKIIPSSVVLKSGRNFEAAAFNYVYVEAIKQKLMGDKNDALKIFEQCIKINPESDASYYQIAQILVANGDIKNGKYYVSKALSLDGENVWYLVMMAGIYYQESKLDSAIYFYEKAVKVFPEKVNLQFMLGNLYSENRNFEKANSIFNSLDQKYGVNEKSTLAAIKNLMLQENYDEALLKTKELLRQQPDEILYNGLLAEIFREKGEGEKAMEVYLRLIDRNPDDAQTQLSLCDFLINEKAYDELFSLLNTVVLNNKITREDKISLLAGLLEMPEVIKEHGAKMILTLMVLEANYKDDDVIPFLRVDIMIKQEHLLDASLRLEEIIRKSPANYYAWEKLLLLYLQMEDYEKIMTKGKECATLFNRSFLAKILYANGAIETKNYSIAVEELRKAEILAGDNKDFLGQVLTMRADVYYRMKEYNKTFEIFDDLLKTDNENIVIINNYAYYLAELNIRLKEAEKMAKWVIETEKNNNTYLDTYAWVLYKRGKLNEAARIMEGIIQSGSKPHAEWYDHYGYILMKQKKCVEAVEIWEKAIKLDKSKTNLIKEIENCKK